ncbi:MAG: cyclic nucleotide-binding domain-containing protein [Inhella sp.]
MEILGYVLGGLGAVLMLASYLMKSMMPLRVVALLACVCLLAYGAVFKALPTLLLYAALVPINIKKVLHMRRLVREIEATRVDDPVADWLLPQMKRREHKAGELLWNKGDHADEMLYLAQGELLLVEHDETLWPDSLVGEIGLFAPDNRRTLSLRCKTDCVVYTMSGEMLQQLYFQSPKLGYHVMRLIVARLMHDVEKAAAKARAAVHAAPRPPGPGRAPMPAMPQ